MARLLLEVTADRRKSGNSEGEMNRLQILAAGAALAVLASAAGAQEEKKKLYCWNEGGRKVCGDALPAHAVNEARTEISARSGMATARVERALNAEERAAAREAEREARRMAMAEEARKRRDHAMAESYATEEDLRKSFQERIVLLDETVKASQLGIEGRRQSLVSLLRKAGESELSGKPVGAKLSEDIRSQHDELLHQQDMLKQQMIERSLADQDLDAALERYHAVKRRPGR